ncbi:carboxylesteras-like protein [Paraphoma chrysanthemicola]|uniref:Carboxylic ester hydrolase n=1 Tax=Paraphoma chrysanthemicola TaxID=798071 RepID=A0A8K0W462_9PLEO|nr:carboxylesteras-like protein [Paraphoma chrysanthemicola]
MSNTLPPLKTPIGTFQGIRSNGVTQYRGIKYASLIDQLSPPELITSYNPDTFVDATSFGPNAPGPSACLLEQATLIQCTLQIPTPDVAPRMSGTECLNLNITAPDVQIQDGKNLPVLVWIHGGGFIMGANSWAHYDPARLVALSEDLGMGIVIVSINYRLGVPGNLTSKELRDAGYPGNNSLRDQKCALQWVKKYIAAFGGDAGNVTVVGESAGASSVLYQLHTKEPLFRRAISMSGTPIMLKSLPVAVAEMSYASIIKNFGLEGASIEERIERLKSTSPEELVEKTPMSIPLLPCLVENDGQDPNKTHLSHHGDTLVPSRTTFAGLAAIKTVQSDAIPGFKWCESLLIGSTKHDGSVFLFMGLMQRKAGIASALSSSLRKHLSADAAAAILDAYDITPTTGDDDAIKRIIDFATDIAYVAPALAYARSFPGKAYLYNFDEVNPWDGPLKGLSSHLLDAASLFQNFDEYLSNEAVKVAKTLALDFVRFVNGMEPWEKFSSESSTCRVYGPSEKTVAGIVDDNGWEQGRRDTLWRLSESGIVDMDAVSVAWDMFLAER